MNCSQSFKHTKQAEPPAQANNRAMAATSTLPFLAYAFLGLISRVVLPSAGAQDIFPAPSSSRIVIIAHRCTRLGRLGIPCSVCVHRQPSCRNFSIGLSPGILLWPPWHVLPFAVPDVGGHQIGLVFVLKEMHERLPVYSYRGGPTRACLPPLGHRVSPTWPGRHGCSC